MTGTRRAALAAITLLGAAPPLAAAAALAVGLGVLKRVVAASPQTEATAKTSAKTTRKANAKRSRTGLDAATRSAIEAARRGQPVPSARALARAHHIGRDKAGSGPLGGARRCG